MGCCDDLIKEINLYIQKADNKLSDELSKKGYKNVDKTMSLINDIEDKIVSQLKDNAEDILDELKDVGSLEDFFKTTWPAIRKKCQTDKVLATYISTKYSKFIPETAQIYMETIDTELKISELTAPTTRWIKSWSAELGIKMKIKQMDNLEKILVDGIDEGKSIDEVAREIQAAGIRENYAYARSTALTETLTAHSKAQLEAYMQNPAVDRKEWGHSGEKSITPRENHIDMDGQVVNVDEPFDLLGADGESYKPMIPRDSSLPPGERINCHCFITPVVNDEVLGYSLEEREKLQQEAIDEINNSDFIERLEEENRKKAGIELLDE